MSHEEALDAMAALALGVLGKSEADQAYAHLRECAICREEFRILRATADVVPLPTMTAADAWSNSDALRVKAQILDQITAVSPLLLPHRSRKTSFPTWIGLLAAVLIGLFFIRTINVQNERIVALSQALAATHATLVEFSAPEVQRFTIAHGTIVRTKNHVYVVMYSAPQLPPGKTFQLWKVERGVPGVVPSTTFLPNTHAPTMVEVPGNAGTIVAIAMSVEPVGGSKAPTTKPMFLRTLN